MIANVCMDPDILTIMKYVNLFITLAKVFIPLIIIVKTSFDLAKVISKGNAEEFNGAIKKVGISVLAGILIFFAPTIVGVIFDFVPNKVDFFACFTDATDENIRQAYFAQAEKYLTKAEDTLIAYDYNTAKTYISRLEDGEEKENLLARLNNVQKTRDDQINKRNQLIIEERQKNKEEEVRIDPEAGDPLKIEGSYYSDGKVIANPGVPLQSEPDPSAAINYWHTQGVVSGNFVYPKDSKTGLSLGAWPANASDIPTLLDSKKTKKYMDGLLIFPITPVNGEYYFGYRHISMDIGAYLGTPVYSPASGTLQYSTWGRTCNLGSDETAYSVSITLDKPFTYDELEITGIFMTHLSGIRYRCDTAAQCNKHISQGELIGFSGNAFRNSETSGWAPHLHISFFTKDSKGLYTEKVEEIYGIVTNGDTSVRHPIKAGG